MLVLTIMMFAIVPRDMRNGMNDRKMPSIEMRFPDSEYFVDPAFSEARSIARLSLLSFEASFLLSVFLMMLTPTRVVGFGVLGLSVIIQIVMSFMEGGPMISILSVFDYAGFLGDVFSYARLMALAIGTAGIALAVNFMTLMVAEIPYVGIIVAILLFVFGHTFNLAMNGLGSFIHTLRLHFLEHFSKYYEGDGKLYKPFLASRKKTHLEVGI